MRRSLIDYIHFAWEVITDIRVQKEIKIARMRHDDISPYVPSEPIRILDLANGQLRPQYLILKKSGKQVFGLDIANQRTSKWNDAAYAIARYLFSLRIIPTLKSHYSNTLICGSADKLPFPNRSFDLVTSVAAFEHFLNVPDTISELHRVLNPGGLIWIQPVKRVQ